MDSLVVFHNKYTSALPKATLDCIVVHMKKKGEAVSNKNSITDV